MIRPTMIRTICSAETRPRIGRIKLVGVATSFPTYGWPRMLERPVPRMVRASPLTTWSALKLIVINACSKAIRPPAIIPTAIPANRLPVWNQAANPPNAPINIMPSSPRFMTPERSEKISPKVANSKGVPLTRAPNNIVIMRVNRVLVVMIHLQSSPELQPLPPFRCTRDNER